MPDFAVYLLKVHIALVVFYSLYFLFLRKLTFYNLNRYYLLGTMVFAVIYPLIDLRFIWKENTPIYTWTELLPALQRQMQMQEVVWIIIETIFWALFTFFLLRLFIRLLSLWRLHTHSVAAKWYSISYRRVFERINPFSFLNHIYVNTDCHKESELTDIFMHEFVHVKEKHSLDMLFVELYTAFGWFNPIVWLYRFAIHENHEFISDQKVLESGVDKQLYQFSLLNTSIQQNNQLGGRLVANFNLRQLKRRIMMMNARQSSKVELGRYAVSIPTIIFLLSIFGFAKGYQHKELVQQVYQTYANGLDLNQNLGDVVAKDSVSPLSKKETKPELERVVSSKETIAVVPNTSPQQNEDQKEVIFKMQTIHTDHDSPSAALNTRTFKRDETYIAPQKIILKGTSLTPQLDARKPTFILDGKVITADELNAINPNDIASVSVNKQADNSGIVIVSTKATSNDPLRSEQVAQEIQGHFVSYYDANRSNRQKSKLTTQLPKQRTIKEAIKEAETAKLGDQLRLSNIVQGDQVMGFPNASTAPKEEVIVVIGKPISVRNR
jgi:hypothetical protein